MRIVPPTIRFSPPGLLLLQGERLISFVNLMESWKWNFLIFVFCLELTPFFFFIVLYAKFHFKFSTWRLKMLMCAPFDLLGTIYLYYVLIERLCFEAQYSLQVGLDQMVDLFHLI